MILFNGQKVYRDGWNDRGMLPSVGLSVAMESGDERLGFCRHYFPVSG